MFLPRYKTRTDNCDDRSHAERRESPKGGIATVRLHLSAISRESAFLVTDPV
jgi:hypothetical protein